MKTINCDYQGIILVEDNFDCDYCEECYFCTDNEEEE